MAKTKSAPSKTSSKTTPATKSRPKAAAVAASTKTAGKKSLAAKDGNGHHDAHQRAHHQHADDHHDHSECDHIDIELDDTSASAIEMAEKSKKFSEELEHAVNKSVFHAVRKFYREHGASLTATQAQNVALMLFGE
jgi:hypothetical protein